MKKHIIAFKFAAVLGLVLMLVPGCTDTRWDLAEDYDFDAIDPVVRGLTGPTEFAASGLAPARYKVNARTGSTYTWTVTGANVDAQEAVPGYPGWVDVTFSQSSVDVDGVTISVVETTSGGKTSAAVSMTTDLKAFCPMTRDDFLGVWVGTEEGISPGDLEVTFVAGSEANEIVLQAVEGIPQVMGGLFVGWGESYQPGFGLEGDIVLQVDELTGAITIATDYWGQTLPGPYDYDIEGDGTWSGCGGAPSMTFTFVIVGYPADYFSRAILTKQ